MSNTKKRVGPPSLEIMAKIREQVQPIQVVIEGRSREDFEYCFNKIFKRKFANEKILSQLKERAQFEKPSAKKRRKKIDAEKRRLQAAAKERMIKSGEWDKRQQKRAKSSIKKSERNAGGLDV